MSVLCPQVSGFFELSQLLDMCVETVSKLKASKLHFEQVYD